jgi:hypothetical protein
MPSSNALLHIHFFHINLPSNLSFIPHTHIFLFPHTPLSHRTFNHPPRLPPPTAPPSTPATKGRRGGGLPHRRRPPLPTSQIHACGPPALQLARRPPALHGAPRRWPQIEAQRIWRQIELLSGVLVFAGGMHIGRRGGESGTFLPWRPPLPSRAPAAESRGRPRRPASAAPRGREAVAPACPPTRGGSPPATSPTAPWPVRGRLPPHRDANASAASVPFLPRRRRAWRWPAPDLVWEEERAAGDGEPCGG